MPCSRDLTLGWHNPKALFSIRMAASCRRYRIALRRSLRLCRWSFDSARWTGSKYCESHSLKCQTPFSVHLCLIQMLKLFRFIKFNHIYHHPSQLTGHQFPTAHASLSLSLHLLTLSSCLAAIGILLCNNRDLRGLCGIVLFGPLVEERD